MKHLTVSDAQCSENHKEAMSLYCSEVCDVGLRVGKYHAKLTPIWYIILWGEEMTVPVSVNMGSRNKEFHS
jgi:hypothetical protein